MSSTYIKLLPFFPLLAFVINSCFLHTNAKIKLAGMISFLGTFISFILALLIFPDVLSSGELTVHLWRWANVSNYEIGVNFMLDELSIILLLMVTGIGSLITLFSIGYMADDERPGKFFSYLSLFIFSMVLLTIAENFLVLFFGWEGVGLCSYLLIGFWYTDVEKAKAGRKAFIANRIGDFGVLLGMIGLAVIFGSLSFTDFKTPSLNLILENKELLAISCGLIVLGVTGKSAQIPLFVWLPDAMAGPTPVSALIHAATMVTAGIFLLCRLSNIFIHVPMIMDVIAWIGGITAILAALIAITQRDIKKVLAYSTVSQLGYMMLACGVGAFSAGMFHVFTHAFFKGLLFLGAGAVIFSLHHEQDMFKMGGLKSKLPITFWTFMVALLAINGIPGFAGFFSKDEILWFTLNHERFGLPLYTIALLTSFLTAFYMSRLVFLVFFAKAKYHESSEHPIKDGPMYMMVPLIILAFFSFAVGYLGLPHFMSHDNSRMFQLFVQKVVSAPREAIYSTDTEHLLMVLTTLGILCSIWLAYFIYVTKEEEQLAKKLKFQLMTLWRASFNKFKIDEFYEIFFLKPIVVFSRFLVGFVEKYIIDGFIRALSIVVFNSGVFLKYKRPDTISGNVLYVIMGFSIIFVIVFSMFSTFK